MLESIKKCKVLFSVIIPLYNKENDIAQTLDSVLKQDYIDFEVIVVNDGSTDKSASVVMNYRDDRIKLYHTDNRGLPSARNCGVKYSNFEYLTFIDADDIWRPNHLSTLVDVITNFPGNNWYGTSYTVLHKNGMEMPCIFYKKWEKGWQGEINNFFTINKAQWLIHICSICVKKEYFNLIGGFNERLDFEEDIDFYIRMALSTPLAYSNNLTLCYNTLGSNRISDSNYKSKVGIDLMDFKDIEAKCDDFKKFLDFFRYTQYVKFKLSSDYDKANIAKPAFVYLT